MSKIPSGKHANTFSRSFSLTPLEAFSESFTENLKMLQGPKLFLTCGY